MNATKHETIAREHDRKPSDEPSDREQEMARLLDEIAEDAQQRPAAYLRETIVPEGGE